MKSSNKTIEKKKDSSDLLNLIIKFAIISSTKKHVKN